MELLIIIICIYIYVCIYVCMYVLVCMYACINVPETLVYPVFPSFIAVVTASRIIWGGEKSGYWYN